MVIKALTVFTSFHAVEKSGADSTPVELSPTSGESLHVPSFLNSFDMLLIRSGSRKKNKTAIISVAQTNAIRKPGVVVLLNTIPRLPSCKSTSVSLPDVISKMAAKSGPIDIPTAEAETNRALACVMDWNETHVEMIILLTTSAEAKPTRSLPAIATDIL